MGDVLNEAPLRNKDTPVMTSSAHFSDSSHPPESVTRGQVEREAGKMYGMYDGVVVVDREISVNRTVKGARRVYSVCTVGKLEDVKSTGKIICHRA